MTGEVSTDKRSDGVGSSLLRSDRSVNVDHRKQSLSPLGSDPQFPGSVTIGTLPLGSESDLTPPGPVGV